MVHGDIELLVEKGEVAGSAQATAKTSPSTVVYLHSAPLVNFLSANTVRQAVLQQPGTLPLHLQCFWVKWKPIPVLLQWVPRALVIPGVKDLILPLMTSAILVLLLSKARRCS